MSGASQHSDTPVVYEICNPSDPYTMAAPTLLHAAAAIVLLGRGRYPLTLEDETAVPFFAFGGLSEWWDERSPDRSLSDFIDEEREAVAAALETVAMPEGTERSSLNNLGSAAAEIASTLREKDKQSIDGGAS